ncbi:MAG: HAD-IA family hydrolase [Gammaproteobacteria bacterium]|nr:HAD-IA family hydrolase [Gammaproteobacteria bacterium]
MLRAPRAICFDLDDTLWEVQPVLRRAEARVQTFLEAEHPALAAKLSAEQVFAVRQTLAAEVPERAHDMTWLRTEALRRLAAQHGHDPAIGERAFEVFIAARHEVEFYPEVTTALAALAGRFRLASFSNGNACVHRIGIGHHFEVTLNSESVGRAKPHPEVYATIAKALDVEPADLLHVGDHPLNDIRGAAEAGCRTAWVNRRGLDWPAEHGAPPDLEVIDLESLLQRLLPLTSAR